MLKKLLTLELFQSISIANSLRLIEITNDKKCWFQCLHSYSVFYKSTIQIIQNTAILDRIVSIDACLIGVLCGETYKELQIQKKKFNINNFFINHNADHFPNKLISINRIRIVEWENIQHKKRFYEDVYSLAQNKEEIQHFNPRDAYHIGFLAGIKLFGLKSNLKTGNPPKKPQLRLIYSRDRV